MALSNKESEFLSTLASSNNYLFKFDRAKEFFNTTSIAKSAIKRLVKKGWLKRIEKGKYLLVPLEAGPEHNWAENAFAIAPQLIQPGAVSYWSAMRYWNMTEQLPKTVFIQTTKRKRSLTILDIPYRFITINKKRYFGITEGEISDKKFFITDREKTFIDALSRPELCGGILHISGSLKQSKNILDWEKITIYLKRWGGGSVVKRLGYLIEVFGLDITDKEKWVSEWQRMLTKGISTLEPGTGKKGKTITKWRILDNISIASNNEAQS